MAETPSTYVLTVNKNQLISDYSEEMIKSFGGHRLDFGGLYGGLS